jgi:hypothetical protein
MRAGFIRAPAATGMSDVEAELRGQFEAAFSGASYPVESATDLLPALPDGPMTTFEAGDLRLTAMQLGTEFGDEAEFPYESVDPLVDDLIAVLRADGRLE